MVRLEDKGRQYKRYRPSSAEKTILAEKGMQWVLSSNVSAVGTDGDDLIVRFVNGSLYQYSKVADLYRPMLESNSKGHFVWVRLRRTGIPYKKIGSMPLKSDTPMSDEDLFENIRKEGIRVESPQVLDERDIMTEFNIFTVGQIKILDDILGLTDSIKIVSNIRQT